MRNESQMGQKHDNKITETEKLSRADRILLGELKGSQESLLEDKENFKIKD